MHFAALLLLTGMTAAGANEPLDDWIPACAARLEAARAELVKRDASLAHSAVESTGGIVWLWMEGQHDVRLNVQVRGRPPRDPHVDSSDSPSVDADTWVDRPIVDKAWTPDKLRRYRWSGQLEAVIKASRQDESTRAPPVPAWLSPWIETLQPVLEACLEHGTHIAPCPAGKPKRYSHSEGEKLFSKVQVGWSRDEVLKMLGPPHKCGGGVWSYSAGHPDGPITHALLIMVGGKVKRIDTSGAGCVFRQSVQ